MGHKLIQLSALNAIMLLVSTVESCIVLKGWIIVIHKGGHNKTTATYRLFVPVRDRRERLYSDGGYQWPKTSLI